MNCVNNLDEHPLFSIITVTYRDVWALTKTARSVFRLKQDDVEYVVIDGNSEDGTQSLTTFWEAAGLVDQSLHEPDSGVYDAMNKGIKLATGQYICFLNSGDVFAHDDVINQARDILSGGQYDGCLGWGELNGQIWASWHEGEAFKLSSLGFCHQALFVKRSLLCEHLFDSRRHKTDSDTLQLGRLYASGACIPVVPEIWAIRGGEPGISANLEKTKLSIMDTLLSEYPSLGEVDADKVIAFRRRCEYVEHIVQLMHSGSERLCEHLAYMVLDTLFQRQSKVLEHKTIVALFKQATNVLGSDATISIEKLLAFQEKRYVLLSEKAKVSAKLQAEINVFREQEEHRFKKVLPIEVGDNKQPYTIALTSFPARMSTLPFVIRSLVEQTYAPKQINLYLGRDEIPNRNWLSRDLLAFEERGLNICFVERTFHQYDKFLHGAELNINMPYVIVDDDVIYHPYSMEILLKAHAVYPEAVIGSRCHLMTFDKDGDVRPYKNWKREVRLKKPSFRLMPTGAAGVLYPVGFLNDPSVTDISSIMRMAPYADDIWLKICALAKQIPTFATTLSCSSKWYHRYTPTMTAGTLMATNVDLGLNDIQFQSCTQWLDQYQPTWRELFDTESEGEVLC